jgi:hypothetical protein
MVKKQLFVSCIAVCFIAFSSCIGTHTHILDIGEGIPLDPLVVKTVNTSSLRHLMLLGNELFCFPELKDVSVVLDTALLEEKGRWSSIGKGPGEYVHAIVMNTEPGDTSFWILDERMHKLCRHVKKESDYTSIVEDRNILYIPQPPIGGGCVLNGCYVVGSAPFGIKGTSPLIVTDCDGNFHRSIGTLPDKAHESVSKTVLDGRMTDYRTYGSEIAACDTRFVQAMTYYGYISFWEMLKDGEVRLIKEQFLEPIKYKGDNTLDARSLKRGFIRVAMSEKYVFATYCGKPYDDRYVANDLLVFSHDGEYICDFLLDQNVGEIAVTKDGKTLFAEISDPDVEIAVYRLPL